jgi:hypothetical protein
MSQSINSQGIFALSSGNLLRWYREDIPGHRGAIRAEFRSEPSHRDKKEGKQYLASMVPGTAQFAVGEVAGAARTKSLMDRFIGRGSSN